MSEAIPFVDLTAQYHALKPEIGRAIDAVLESHAFIQGPYVEAFENEFAAATGSAHGIGCSNGTAAISLALEAMGIGHGDEVITVSHTFFATAEAIFHVGARPVFVDIESQSYTIDASLIEPAVTPRTKAIIPVHLYGTPCDMDAVMAVAKRHNLLVLEDAAQAHLALYRGRVAGTLGDAATFSFYPGKNLGAYGDAGFITTGSEPLAQRMRRLRDHGRLSKYEHDVIGYNHRMDGLQAAVLSVKLKRLPHWTEARRRHAVAYDRRLSSQGFKTIVAPSDVQSAYHLYVVEVANRDAVMKALRENGISTGVHYPVPLHLQPALAGRLPSQSQLSTTEKVASRIMSLPMFPELTSDQIERVCDVFLRHARA